MPTPHRRSLDSDLAATVDERMRYVTWVLGRHEREATHPAVLRAIRGQLAKADWCGAQRAARRADDGEA